MLVRYAMLAIVLVSPFASAGESAAEEGAAPARKILVVAKIKEEAKRRQLEEQAKTELQKRGVETILGSDVMEEADFASVDTIRKKVESLGVDGVLGFVPLAIDESVKTSSASVSVGVGFGGGGMGMFIGGSRPIGSSSTVVRKVHLRSRYFARPFDDPSWEKEYKETLPDDTTRLTQYLASDAVKALKKKKLIPAK
jgi:hypothetical protein